MKEGIPILRWEMPAEFSNAPKRSAIRRRRRGARTISGRRWRRLEPERASFFGEDFGRSGDLTVIWPLQIGRDSRAAHAVRRRAAQHPVSQPGAGAVLYRRPAAAVHRGRDGRARQRAVPGGDGGAALWRANRAGDAVGGVVSGEYAALQGGVRGRHDRDSEGRRHFARPSRDRGRARRREDFRSADWREGKGRHGDSAMAAALAFFATRAEPGKIGTSRRDGRGRASRRAGIRLARRRWRRSRSGGCEGFDDRRAES